jgi:hypothetical protein
LPTHRHRTVLPLLGHTPQTARYMCLLKHRRSRSSIYKVPGCRYALERQAERFGNGEWFVLLSFDISWTWESREVGMRELFAEGCKLGGRGSLPLESYGIYGTLKVAPKCRSRPRPGALLGSCSRRRGHMGRGPGEPALTVWLLARDDYLPTPSRIEMSLLHLPSHPTRCWSEFYYNNTYTCIDLHVQPYIKGTAVPSGP